ncbi:MAG: RNA methyltransferase [Candidatus Eisenbacteria bacterium]|uniref:tRNA (cytidine/uridine-2'-O-)-methyltransferase TrmJ n=1 Tax=Eiseniibacteriota bacterium TaxID=2212470 RepID=A0A7Y2E9H5_UNCEI|nr:RNA methyltransferase [Candidatus Eisenbacteria bacterium]
MISSSVHIVLVRPEEAGNVGAAARAMANFGLTHLTLVEPRMRRAEERFKWARGAEDILEGARYTDSLAEAIHDCTAAWATSRRSGKLRGPFLTPAEALQRVVPEPNSPVAWVFGPESTGLETEEISLCTGVVTIPTSSKQPSLNLAQAVAICTYETRKADLGDSENPPKRLASSAEFEGMFDHLEQSLKLIGFFKPSTQEAQAKALRRILHRSHLTSKEARYLRGFGRRLSRLAGLLERKP